MFDWLRSSRQSNALCPAGQSEPLTIYSSSLSVRVCACESTMAATPPKNQAKTELSRPPSLFTPPRSLSLSLFAAPPTEKRFFSPFDDIIVVAYYLHHVHARWVYMYLGWLGNEDDGCGVYPCKDTIPILALFVAISVLLFRPTPPLLRKCIFIFIEPPPPPPLSSFPIISSAVLRFRGEKWI